MTPRPLDKLAGLLPGTQAARLERKLAGAAAALAGRAVWNVSGSAAGDGEAEMLYTPAGYLRAAGIDTRWYVLDGDEDFFAVTKRLRNAVRGMGGPSGLGPAARSAYQRALDRNLPALRGMIRSQDVVVLHDPQAAGLAGPLRRAGARIAWRSYIGPDQPDEPSRAGWDFLRPYIEDADAFVVSRRQQAPGWIPPERLWVIPPSIDPLSARNRPIPRAQCNEILARAGLLSVGGAPPAPGIHGAPAPGPGARLVVQVGRWDRLTDMAGVMTGLAEAAPSRDVHLMLVGASSAGGSDDPEGAEVLAECVAAWHELPGVIRDRVSLASIPTGDPAENATIVNAVQRHATVMVQNSFAEGSGLTVAEAMWKAKPVVAAAVGGIQDQITNEQEGLLIGDPSGPDGPGDPSGPGGPADPAAFAAALHRLLADPRLGRRLGEAAQRRARDSLLDDRHVGQSADLFTAMLAGGRAGRIRSE